MPLELFSLFFKGMTSKILYKKPVFLTKYFIQSQYLFRMKAFILLVFINLPGILAAQQPLPAGYIKKNKLDPDSTWQISSLSRYFNSNYSRPDEKISAIYRWVISNISYNTDSVYIINSYANPQAKVL